MRTLASHPAPLLRLYILDVGGHLRLFFALDLALRLATAIAESCKTCRQLFEELLPTDSFSGLTQLFLVSSSSPPYL
jgi:hypothetical protein